MNKFSTCQKALFGSSMLICLFFTNFLLTTNGSLLDGRFSNQFLENIFRIIFTSHLEKLLKTEKTTEKLLKKTSGSRYHGDLIEFPLETPRP